MPGTKARAASLVARAMRCLPPRPQRSSRPRHAQATPTPRPRLFRLLPRTLHFPVSGTFSSRFLNFFFLQLSSIFTGNAPFFFTWLSGDYRHEARPQIHNSMFNQSVHMLVDYVDDIRAEPLAQGPKFLAHEGCELRTRKTNATTGRRIALGRVRGAGGPSLSSAPVAGVVALTDVSAAGLLLRRDLAADLLCMVLPLTPPASAGAAGRSAAARP